MDSYQPLYTPHPTESSDNSKFSVQGESQQPQNLVAPHQQCPRAGSRRIYVPNKYNTHDDADGVHWSCWWVINVIFLSVLKKKYSIILYKFSKKQKCYHCYIYFALIKWKLTSYNANFSDKKLKKYEYVKLEIF